MERSPSLYGYALEIHQEPAGVWLSCSDIPEMHAAGETLVDAFAKANDAMATALSFYVDQNRLIPKAGPRGDTHPLLHLPVMTVAKILLWNALLAEELSKSELARRLGGTQRQVDQLLNFLQPSKIESIERALHVLGRRLVVVIQ